MKTNHQDRLPRTFWWHNLTQFGGAMNDNIFKLFMLYALFAWQPEVPAASILATVGLTFALPFLLIVPIAGSFADKYSKQRMIVILKGAEVIIMAFGIYALYSQQSWLLYLTMFLMSSQSAFFGPCKYGIIPEQVGKERLSRANGALQLFTFLAIICGTVIAPELSLRTNHQYSLAAGICLVIAACGFATSLRIAPSPAHPTRALSFNGFRNLWTTLQNIRGDGFLVLAVSALAVFALAAAFIQLNVLDYGYEHLALSREASTRLFLLTAIGIGVGSTLAGWLSGRAIEFGIVPIGAAIMSASLATLALMPDGGVVAAAICMFTLGLAAGLFIVPLEAFIQYRSPADKVGSIQAASSFTSWLGILIASALLYLSATLLGWTPKEGFLMLAVGLAVLTVFSLWILPDFFAKFLIMIFTRCCYKLRVYGLENLPADGPALVISNHISLMDAVLLVSSQNRRMRMLMSRNFYENSNWIVRKAVDLSQVILIQDSDGPKQLLKSLQSARQAMDAGYLVTIFAEGSISRTGMMRPFKAGFERIVKGTDYPIIPVYIGGAWGSVASYHKGMPQLRPLKDFRYPVSVHYGTPLPAQSTSFEVQQAVSALSTESFEQLKNKERNLGLKFIDSARRNWRKLAIADSSGSELSYGRLLTASLLLRQLLRAQTSASASKVAILLPPGSGSAISNLALTLDQRIAVNLNYTASADSLRSAMDQCEIETVITSRKFLERFPDIPLPPQQIYLEEAIASCSKADKVKAALLARLVPRRMLMRGSRNADDLATVLFSSGSTAEPKGIMLSHHNLLSNIESFRSVLSPVRNDVVLTALPFFHSFGYTATFWFPLLSGITIACHTNPLEGEAIGKLAEKYRASILLSTPSFLLAYARKVKPAQFAHLRYVFTGAEKLQPRISDLFEQRFGTRPLEGYGATELSPVCAISLPNVVVDELPEIGNRPERLGRPLPGIALKIVHVDSGETLAPGEEGLICVKGPNVMLGYLNRDDLTAAAIKDGWYHTGDIGLIDTDGFFAITGRASRFSKIGGEMIPHGAIEEALQAAFELDPTQLSVVALPDERKGERLFVIYTDPSINQTTIRETLQQVELPNLWKPNPKDWVQLDRLPLLGTGKLDHRQLKSYVAATSEKP
jgi:acyl-[acyl-carrier-protein]-phospholipid O-acyltransferase/long-chain-fatty-acid--[acyl-carrier-protein] ligase